MSDLDAVKFLLSIVVGLPIILAMFSGCSAHDVYERSDEELKYGKLVMSDEQIKTYLEE